MIRKLIVSAILITLVVAVGFMGAGFFIRNRKQPQQREVKAIVTLVQAPAITARENYQIRLIGYGTTRPKVQLQISPQVAGEIDYRSEKFLSGRMVQGPSDDGNVGDELFRIDSERYQLTFDNATQKIAVLQARLNRIDQEEKNLHSMRNIESERLSLDKRELERYQQLFKENASTQNEVERAMSTVLGTRRSLQEIENQIALIPEQRAEIQAELASAKVQQMQAKVDLDDARYFAPVTGRIISSKVDKGDFVQAGEVCGEMYGTAVMEIPVSILANDLRWIDRKAIADGGSLPAEVHWEQPGLNGDVTWTGQVDRIEAGLEAQTRTAQLVVVVDNTDESPRRDDEAMMLDFNMYCRVVIDGRAVPRAFLLPREAILRGEVVYIAQPAEEGDGFILVEQNVKVARYTNGEAMILPGGGLHDGDRVVISRVARPVIGMKVHVREPDASSDGGAAPANTASGS